MMEPISLQSRNFYVEKHNLVLVCRFVIKSVIDKASVGDVDEDCPEIINLLATIEHILNHHAKGSLFNAGYGTFWNFIRDATSKMSDSCIPKVLAIGSLKNSLTRGRCWLRLVLMEKRLAEYLQHAVVQQHLVRKYYTDGAILASEEMQLLIADIIGLEAVDFNFCLRNMNASLEGRFLVDYSPYLKFVHCKEGIENDLQEIQESKTHTAASHTSSSHSVQVTESSSNTHSKSRVAAIADSDLKDRLAALQRAFRTSSEQKGYLEQMLKKSELEMVSKQAENENILKEKALLISKHEKEVSQLEHVVLELQNDLAKAKANNKEMQSVITHLYKRINGPEPIDRATVSKADESSMYSDNMSMDDLTFREDSSSLKPLVGSLLSDSGSLTASYDRGRRLAESAPLSASTKNLSSNLDGTNGRGVLNPRRARAASELNQETTSKYITSGHPNG